MKPLADDSRNSSGIDNVSSDDVNINTGAPVSEEVNSLLKQLDNLLGQFDTLSELDQGVFMAEAKSRNGSHVVGCVCGSVEQNHGTQINFFSLKPQDVEQIVEVISKAVEVQMQKAKNATDDG